MNTNAYITPKNQLSMKKIELYPAHVLEKNGFFTLLNVKKLKCTLNFAQI